MRNGVSIWSEPSSAAACGAIRVSRRPGFPRVFYLSTTATARISRCGRWPPTAILPLMIGVVCALAAEARPLARLAGASVSVSGMGGVRDPPDRRNDFIQIGRQGGLAAAGNGHDIDFGPLDVRQIRLDIRRGHIDAPFHGHALNFAQLAINAIERTGRGLDNRIHPQGTPITPGADRAINGGRRTLT